ADARLSQRRVRRANPDQRVVTFRVVVCPPREELRGCERREQYQVARLRLWREVEHAAQVRVGALQLVEQPLRRLCIEVIVEQVEVLARLAPLLPPHIERKP